MKFYRETECISAQIQATGASLQIGSTIWGVAPERWFEPGGRRRDGGSRFFGRLIINAPECSRGLKVAFELRTPWFTLKRIGIASPDSYDRSSVGWYLRRQMCSGVNI
jgi:hypothetical protein